MCIVSLLTDFGQKDPYVAEMKAVILSLNPEVKFVDVTHQITKFSIHHGAYCLASASPYFPLKTIHLAVVDPGVGTKRRPIIIQTKGNLYVGPDNGLMILAAQKETLTHVYSIENTKYMLPERSNTFHGRDIFAPVVAHLTQGVPPDEFGLEIHDYLVPQFAKPKIETGKIVGQVLHIDDFGNVISNITSDCLMKAGVIVNFSVCLVVGDQTFKVPFCSAYGKIAVGGCLVLVGGSGFVEVAVNQGDASKVLGARVGDLFCLSMLT